MPEPVEIEASAGCCDDAFEGHTCSELLTARLQQIVCRLRLQTPEVFVRASIYRPYIAVEDPNTSSDDQDVRIAKIADGIVCVSIEKQDRWFQIGYGQIHIRVRELWVPAVFRVRPDDHVVLENREQAMVIDGHTVSGITITKIDDSKTRLTLPPPDTDRVNRIIYGGARIE